MYTFSLGVMLDSFRCDFRSAMEQAAAVGAQGIQLSATYGEFSPESITAEKIRLLRDLADSNGLVFSALCGDFGQGLYDNAKNPSLIERSRRVLELAKELGTDVVTTHIGVVPENPTHERYKIMQQACHTLASYADSLSAHFAIETGPETSAVLKAFLDSLCSHGVAVNLDPANLVMVTGDDPVQAVYNLRDYIVHTHAKDGVRHFYKDPEIVYGIRREDPPTGPSFSEVPLGKGKVDFKNYLAALHDIGYRGFLTIEREVGDNPAADIRTAVDYLRQLMA